VSRDTLSVEVAGLTRELSLVEVTPGIVVPVFHMLGDVELVESVADALAGRVPEQAEMLVCVASKTIPLAHALAVRVGLPYAVLRRRYRPYMGAVIEAQVMDIFTARPITLLLEEKDRARCHGRNVLLLEDVVSTGSASSAMRTLMDRAGARVIGEMAVFTEGRAERWPDVIALGHLPLFTSELD